MAHTCARRKARLEPAENRELAPDMQNFHRRQFFFASSGAAAGSFLATGIAGAAEGDHLDFSESGLVTGKPKPLKHKEIPGFLSAAQIAPHHTAHYGGALTAFGKIDQAM